MYGIFEKLVSEKKIIKNRLISIRVKLHNNCQWTCNFCHMEGNPLSQSIKTDKKFFDILKSFRDYFQFSEVHFTGGEPTIYPKLNELIAETKNLGFKTKITTNGQAKISKYFEFIKEGLDEINISMHTLNPEELRNMMLQSRSNKWANKSIEKQIKIIEELNENIAIKVNTCIGDKENPAIDIAKFIKEKNISWRLMNVLEMPDISYASLKRACHALKATPLQASIIQGSSSCSVDMQCEDGFTFKVKLIRPYFLEEMCKNCKLLSKSKCYEFAYGPRLEMEKDRLMIRNCIHREGYPFSVPVNDYFSSKIARQLRENLRI